MDFEKLNQVVRKKSAQFDGNKTKRNKRIDNWTSRKTKKKTGK